MSKRQFSSEPQPSNSEDNLMEAIGEYCDGYCLGFHEGGEKPTGDGRFDDGSSKAYRAGYERGRSAGRRNVSPVDRQAKEDLSEEVDSLDKDYHWQGQRFTQEQRERWNVLQRQIQTNGNNEWQEVLLETYRNLTLFPEGTKLSADESEAVRLVSQTLLIRLARTALADDLT